MHLQESTLFDLDLQVMVTLNVAQCPLHHVTYALTEFEVTTSKALGGEGFTRKFNIWSLTLALGSRSHKMLPSTLYIMWPIQLQSLKLLGLTIKEEIHLQENTLFDLWPWPWGQGHTKCCPVPSTSCDLFSYKVWSCYVERFRRRCIYKKIQYLTFDLDPKVKVTQNVAQYPLHHVTYPATKFEVTMSNRLGGDTITRIYNIWPMTLTLGSRSHEMVPSSLYIMWPIQLRSL